MGAWTPQAKPPSYTNSNWAMSSPPFQPLVSMWKRSNTKILNLPCGILAVDSNDRERIDDGGTNENEDNVRDQLHQMLADDELRNAALLVLANKQDLPNAMSVDQITQKLQLNKLRNRDWYIQGSCARSGDGLYEGLDWLSNTLKKRKK